MFAQSSDSVHTDDIAEFLDESIKGKGFLLGQVDQSYNV